jgi:proteic killer suppression protein
MEVTFATDDLRRLAYIEAHRTKLPLEIVAKYIQRVDQIQSALDERDFRAMRSLNFEKLKGDRAHQHSMRLNDQWRLILELRGDGPSKVAHIVAIEDYH